LPDFVYMTQVKTFLICLNVVHRWLGFYIDLRPTCPSTPRKASLWMRGTNGMFKTLGRTTMERGEQAAATARRKTFNALSRRDLLAGSVATGAAVILHGGPSAAADGKKTFTILHTNDLHSNLIGMGPASDYTPFTLNDDTTRGGFARLATMIAKSATSVARSQYGSNMSAPKVTTTSWLARITISSAATAS
jgi:hypothetical protein